MSEGPKRIQRQRTKGWRMPPNTVYVGRETRWGHRWMPAHFWWSEDRAKVVVEVYRDTLLRRLRANPRLLDPLRDKHLACWCSLDQPCHADVLLELANRQESAPLPDGRRTHHAESGREAHGVRDGVQAGGVENG